jgi:NUDIX domain-containing protein
MYVIFYNNKPIFLTKNRADYTADVTYDIDKKLVLEILKELDTEAINSVCIVHSDHHYLFEKFVANFKVIKAAGGLVYNEKKELLFIFRNDLWDLPKGKVEKGESVEKAALREVEEECGITDLQLGNFIDKTYHIYQYKNQSVFKITHWYKMTSRQKSKLVPQLEEGITKAVFLDKTGQEKALQNTYPNIKMLIDAYNLSL